MTEKLCRKCGRLLPLDEFPVVKGYRTSPCKGCKRLYNFAWRHKQSTHQRLKKRKREYMREWRAQNPGYQGCKKGRVYDSDCQQRYRAEYRARPGVQERERVYQRAYYVAHREQKLAQKRRRELDRVLRERVICCPSQPTEPEAANAQV
jgi:hypothetical protein